MQVADLYRFIEKITREGDCWMWMGSTSDGYADFTANGRRAKGHVAAYEHFVGKVPEGCELDHLCRNRNCVNPRHLDPVTHQENVLRGEGIAAKNARKTVCKRGHPLDGINPTTGNRFCRECARNTKLRYQRRKKIERKK